MWEFSGHKLVGISHLGTHIHQEEEWRCGLISKGVCCLKITSIAKRLYKSDAAPLYRSLVTSLYIHVPVLSRSDCSVCSIVLSLSFPQTSSRGEGGV